MKVAIRLRVRTGPTVKDWAYGYFYLICLCFPHVLVTLDFSLGSRIMGRIFPTPHRKLKLESVSHEMKISTYDLDIS